MERERSGEQTKLAAQISVKGDMLLKLRNAVQTLFYTMSKKIISRNSNANTVTVTAAFVVVLELARWRIP